MTECFPNQPVARSFPCRAIALTGLVLAAFATPAPLRAQSPADKPADDRLKAIERERDELKKRTDVLETRVKQLQDALDKLGQPRIRPAAPSEAPYWERDRPNIPRESIAPRGSDFAGYRMPPMVATHETMPDIVSIAVAFSDAVSDVESARPYLEMVRKQMGNGGSNPRDAVAASGQLQKAERRLRLLRKIITTMRDELAAEADRIRNLTKVGAIPSIVVAARDARVKLLDQILAEDPERPAKPADANSSK
jgi:hypothetical protein